MSWKTRTTGTTKQKGLKFTQKEKGMIVRSRQRRLPHITVGGKQNLRIVMVPGGEVTFTETLTPKEQKAFELWARIDNLQHKELTYGKQYLIEHRPVYLRLLEDAEGLIKSMEKMSTKDHYLARVRDLKVLAREGDEPAPALLLDDLKNCFHYNIGNFKWYWSDKEYQKKTKKAYEEY